MLFRSDEVDSEPDGINPRDELNAVAIAGGAPLPFNAKFHNVMNQTLLAQNLEQVAAQVLGCTFTFPEPATYADWVEITIGEADWGRPWVNDCATEDGWMYTNEEKTELRLCGQMCVDAGKAGGIDYRFRCPVD